MTIAVCIMQNLTISFNQIFYVDMFIECMYTYMFDSDPGRWAALVAQLVEHLSGVQSVVGSDPT